ncbi:MAG: RDD family protein [Mycobacteriaceae bacterium]|nr:RDD family protein [Mycobacteriaceae bacterium]
MARITGSWLSGPSPAGPGVDPAGHRGKLLGLPESGRGSLAATGRRVAALFVDWILAVGAASIPAALSGNSVQTWTLLVWFLIGVTAVSLFGFTPGQYFLRLRVARLDADAPVGFVRALARQIMLAFVVPALFADGDGRGMHDRSTGTAVVNSR